MYTEPCDKCGIHTIHINDHKNFKLCDVCLREVKAEDEETRIRDGVGDSR